MLWGFGCLVRNLQLWLITEDIPRKYDLIKQSNYTVLNINLICYLTTDEGKDKAREFFSS